MKFDFKQLAFVTLFFALALASANIKFIPLWGANGQYVSLLHFFAPIAGGFLGSIPGVLAVFGAEVVNLGIQALQGKTASFTSLLLLFPILFGVLFFAKPSKRNGLIISLGGMALWFANPIGREAWMYSALFLVPLAASQFQNLAGRSLGAAYTAFVAGQILWLYFVPSTAAQWISWIPLVLMERTAFAVGIAVSHIAFNTILSRIPQSIPQSVIVEKRYDAVAFLRG